MFGQDYIFGIFFVLVVFGPFIALAVYMHNDQERARRLGPYGGHLPLRRWDVLPQDDPPVAAPYPGVPTGS